MAESTQAPPTGTLATISTVVYYTCWPIIKIIQGIGFVLSPFWTLTQFVLLPITYLIHGILSIVLFPFRLQLLERVEVRSPCICTKTDMCLDWDTVLSAPKQTIYIYLGIAGLIGCITGAILHFSFSFLSSTFSIDTASETKALQKGRTAAEYRAGRRRRNEKPIGYSSTPTVVKKEGPFRKQRGLLSQTIIEEEDSDF